MRFVPPSGDRVSPHTERAYVVGVDHIPYPTSVTLTPEALTVSREVNESGSLFMPYRIPEVGEYYLSTASLMERDAPYLLQLELARGTVNRLRNQAVEWEMAGLNIAADLKAKIRHAATVFARAAALRQSSPDEAQELAGSAIVVAYKAIDRLGEEYGRQALAFRHQAADQLSTLMAGDLGMETPYEGESAAQFRRAFNSVSIPVSWRQIEPDSGEFDWSQLDRHVAWCERMQMRAICLGPIFVPRKELLPDWLYIWEDDFEQLQSRVTQFVQQVVQRYQGRVLLWHCASGLNRPRDLKLSEEQRLRLAVRTIETVRQLNHEVPVITTIEDPWGEYMREHDVDLSPIHFADELVRTELGLAGIGLKLNFGSPSGPTARDALEISQLIDRWAILGQPLMLTTSIVGGPNRDGELPQMQFEDAEAQARQASWILPILLAKQMVHGVIWGQLDDRQPHQRDAAGAFDEFGHPKPVLDIIAKLRSEHLS